MKRNRKKLTTIIIQMGTDMILTNFLMVVHFAQNALRKNATSMTVMSFLNVIMRIYTCQVGKMKTTISARQTI